MFVRNPSAVSYAEVQKVRRRKPLCEVSALTYPWRLQSYRSADSLHPMEPHRSPCGVDRAYCCTHLKCFSSNIPFEYQNHFREVNYFLNPWSRESLKEILRRLQRVYWAGFHLRKSMSANTRKAIGMTQVKTKVDSNTSTSKIIRTFQTVRRKAIWIQCFR